MAESFPSKAIEKTDFVKKIGRIVDRVTEEDSNDSSLIRKRGSGSLSPADLAELSLLCTLHSNLEHQEDTSASNEDRSEYGFNSVEPVQLIVIVRLLDRLINRATGIKFLASALEVLESADSPSHASSAMDQVRSAAFLWMDPLQSSLLTIRTTVDQTGERGTHHAERTSTGTRSSTNCTVHGNGSAHRSHCHQRRHH